jgi:hypothetical protein
MRIPNYKGKSAKEILSLNVILDSAGYFYLASCWLDLFERDEIFQALLNSAMSARMGVEHFIFEEIIVATGAKLTEAQYKKCLENKGKLEKMLFQINPEYLKLQEFTKAVVKLEHRAPQLIYPDIKDLMKKWGILSSYLHWRGVHARTSGSPEWVSEAKRKVGNVVKELSQLIASGQSGIMHPDDMKPDTKTIWLDFLSGTIDSEGVTKRHEIMRSVISRQQV